MNISLPTSVFLGAVFMAAVPSMAQAQTAPLSPSFYASQMGAGVGVGNMRPTRHGYQSRRGSTRGGDSSTTQAAGVPPYLTTMVATRMQTELTPEYNRQAAAYGKAGADRWYVNGARQVGQEMRALLPEYHRQVQNQGRARADAWYIGRAQNSARRYAVNAR